MPRRPPKPASTLLCSIATGPNGRPAAASICWSPNTDGTEVRDLTPGKRDVPPFSLGGPDGYAISPDSLELAFVMNVDSNPAASTNSDIYTVPLDGGEARKITISPGARRQPSLFARRKVSGVPLAAARRL